MTVYIALLRGINVGGKNMIKMAELKRVFESIGLCEVLTYIQSGNVLFKSEEKEDFLRKAIEDKIRDVFEISVTVILRTAAEFEQIINNCPFTEEEVLEAERLSTVESLYVALLTQIPLQEKMEQLNIYANEKEKYQIIGREVYLLLHHSIRDSKLANHLNKLDVPATVRNFKTISKIASLVKNMEN